MSQYVMYECSHESRESHESFESRESGESSESGDSLGHTATFVFMYRLIDNSVVIGMHCMNVLMSHVSHMSH